MKKWLKRFLVAVVLLLAILLALLCEEHFRGELALNSRLKELAARHEKLAIAELQPPKIPPEQNAALNLVALTNSLKPYFNLSKTAPSLMKFASPGCAYVSWQGDSWPVDEKTSYSWAQFSPEIEASLPELARLEGLWSKPGYDDGLDYSKGFTDMQLPLLVFCKQAAILLQSAVADDLRRRNLDAAQRHLRSLLAVTKALGSEHLIISQLVDIACASIAFNATWETLQAAGWNDAQLAELQAEWDVNNFPMSMLNSFDMERDMTLVTFRDYRNSHSKALEALKSREMVESSYDGAFGILARRGLLSNGIYLSVWEKAWAAQDELRALNRWQDLIESAKTASADSWLETRRSLPKYDPNADDGIWIDGFTEDLGIYDKFRFPFSSGIFSVSTITFLKSLKMETQKHMAITAIALKRYQVRYSKQADALSDLVPEFLAALPIDRMDGKPLRYHLNVDGSFRLYSVGTNGTDEDGDASRASATDTSSDIWKGKDAVWPMLPNAMIQGNEGDSRQRH